MLSEIHNKSYVHTLSAKHFMTVAMISLSDMMCYFNDEMKSVKRGENHFKSGHVFLCSVTEGQLKGSVRASMKDRTYNVVIYTDDNGITTTTCECPRGTYKCSHAAALMIWAIHNVSATDVECTWKKPSGLSSEVASVEELFPTQRPPLLACVTPDDHKWLQSQFKGRFNGITWLLTPEPDVPADPLLSFSTDSIVATHKNMGPDAIIDALKLSQENISAIQKATTDQRENKLWHALRRGRITASNFGVVLSAKRLTPSIITKVIEKQDLRGVRAVEWGNAHEKEGIKTFEEATGKSVSKSGLWLSSSGMLGASPDGLIGETDILEVKCPYKWRENTLEEAIQDKHFYVTRNEAGKYKLKTDHAYWHQVQGQLHLTGRNSCYFTIWTTRECLIIQIFRDESWKNNLSILETFFKSHILPNLF